MCPTGSLDKAKEGMNIEIKRGLLKREGKSIVWWKRLWTIRSRRGIKRITKRRGSLRII